MSRGSFRQVDIERLIRAARRESAVIQVDLRNLSALIVPLDEDDRNELRRPYRDLFLASDGRDNFDD